MQPSKNQKYQFMEEGQKLERTSTYIPKFLLLHFSKEYIVKPVVS